MINLEDRIRMRAYELWERAGCPDGRSWEFWFAARRDVEAEGAGGAEAAFPHGVPVGMPGERIVEQGVENDRLADLLPGRKPRLDD